MGAFNIYLEEDLPPGVLRSSESRRSILAEAFFKAFREKNGREPDVETVKQSVKRIVNQDESSHERLPIFQMSHESLALIRLYFRHGRYELHCLSPEASTEELLNIVLFDELEHGTAGVDPIYPDGSAPENCGLSRQKRVTA